MVLCIGGRINKTRYNAMASDPASDSMKFGLPIPNGRCNGEEQANVGILRSVATFRRMHV